VEDVLEIHVGGDVAVDRVPASKVYQGVARGVIDVKAGEVVVRTPSDETAAKVGSPAIAEIADERSPGMLGTAKQRSSGGEDGIAEIRRRAERRFQVLR